MASYAGAQTAEKQQELRRAMKHKQKFGKKKRRSDRDVDAVKIPRHLSGKFSKSTEEAISREMQANPTRPFTTEGVKKLLRNGDISVTIGTEEHPLNGDDLIIKEDGFDYGIQIFTVSVFTAGGFGVKFKLVGGRNGKPERVIVL